MKRLIAVLVVVLFSSISIYAEEKAATGEKVMAEVNGVKITESEFQAETESLPANYQKFVSTNKKKFIDDLVLQEVLYQEAKKENLENDKDVVSSLEMAKKKILVQRLLQLKVVAPAKVSPEEVTKYYGDNKDSFKEPEQINAAHILIKVDEKATEAEDKAAKEKTEGLLKEIKGGANFSDLAKNNSDCPSKENGGELGFFSEGQMVPEFEEAAFKLKKDEVSGVVKTKFGYHIIKVLDKKEAKEKELDEVKDEIGQKLSKEKQKNAFDEYTKSLKEKAKITINEDSLK